LPNRHEPGEHVVLGRRYPQTGAEQAMAVLRDLARHPATARHVTHRLARHFLGDATTPRLQASLAETYLATQGDLAAVTGALIDAPEAWAARPHKLRPPIEMLLGAARLFGGLPDRPAPLAALQAMGQPFWGATSPAGWPEEDDAWASPDSLKTRLDWALELSARLSPGLDPRALAAEAFGTAASNETLQAIERAASVPQGLTLLVLSPEFQRR
jgi:uncharacterized protein (DUF1800 family)